MCHECVNVDFDLVDNMIEQQKEVIVTSLCGSNRPQCDNPRGTVCEENDKCATMDITYNGMCKSQK